MFLSWKTLINLCYLKVGKTGCYTLGIDTTLFPTFEQATLLLNFLAPQPQRNNRLPTNELFFENEILINVAFVHLYGLLLMIVGRRLDDETTRNKVLMQILLCRKSSFNGTWLDELEEFLKNVEYTCRVIFLEKIAIWISFDSLFISRLWKKI